VLYQRLDPKPTAVWFFHETLRLLVAGLNGDPAAARSARAGHADSTHRQDLFPDRGIHRVPRTPAGAADIVQQVNYDAAGRRRRAGTGG